jgi:hypothetical protein
MVRSDDTCRLKLRKELFAIDKLRLSILTRSLSVYAKIHSDKPSKGQSA